MPRRSLRIWYRVTLVSGKNADHEELWVGLGGPGRRIDPCRGRAHLRFVEGRVGNARGGVGCRRWTGVGERVVRGRRRSGRRQPIRVDRGFGQRFFREQREQRFFREQREQRFFREQREQRFFREQRLRERQRRIRC